MALIKWSPFFLEPFEEDAALDDMRSALIPSASNKGGLIPLVDVYEDGDMLVVEAPLPGMDPNKIELSIDHGALIIKAASERKTEVDEKNYYRKEVRHGVMFRKIPLPAAVQEDAAQASYDDGVLKVRLPKREQNEKTIKLHIKKS